MKKVLDDEDTYLGRSCEGCVFLDTHGRKPNVHCYAGRLEKFQERGEVVDGNLQRFCNLYRDESWTKTKGLTELDEQLKQAVKEGQSKFSIILNADTDKNLQHVEKAVQEILDIKYDKGMMYVVISSYMGWRTEALVHLTNSLTQSGIKACLVLHSEVSSTPETRDFDVMSKCVGASHFITTNCQYDIDPMMLSDIDLTLNQHMVKLLGVRDETQGFHCLAFSMVNSYYPKYRNYGKMLKGIWEEHKDSPMFIEL